jgi:2-polyprenyl-3-methyl-5-hydroxy-6-metoxy-1,4-benzoquinol methylase
VSDRPEETTAAGAPIAAGDRCPICASAPVNPCELSGPDRLHGTPGLFCVAICSVCGAGWTLPPASPEEIDSFYPSSYHAYSPQTGVGGRLQRAARRLILNRALTRQPFGWLAELPPGTLLDVGCGRGDLAATFARRGWRVSGVDPSADACAAARAQGVDARAGTVESVEFAPGSFDAVVMSHSLEHVLEPLADLTRIHRATRPGGFIVISVPNFASWQRAKFGASWFHLDLPRHRTHFTPQALARALTSAGFDLVSVQSASDGGSLLASLQYWAAGRLLLDRGLAAWMGYAIGALLSPLAAFADRMLGEAPLLHAIARRPG